MQIVNASNGAVHWNTSFSTGGGDCGTLSAGAPAYEYKITPQMGTVSITMTFVSNSPVAYDNLQDGDIVAVSSSRETQLPPAE